MTEDDGQSVFISTSDQYDEAFFDLIDYFNNKDFNIVETIGIIEMLKEHILDQQETDDSFNKKRET